MCTKPTKRHKSSLVTRVACADGDDDSEIVVWALQSWEKELDTRAYLTFLSTYPLLFSSFFDCFFNLNIKLFVNENHNFGVKQKGATLNSSHTFSNLEANMYVSICICIWYIYICESMVMCLGSGGWHILTPSPYRLTFYRRVYFWSLQQLLSSLLAVASIFRLRRSRWERVAITWHICMYSYRSWLHINTQFEIYIYIYMYLCAALKQKSQTKSSTSI